MALGDSGKLDKGFGPQTARLAAAAGEAAEPIPLRFGNDPRLWAAWLYYEDRLTQSEIAAAMGLSRATVNATLSDARERGVVTIAIDPLRLSALDLAQAVKRHFGLQDCLVVPSGGPPGQLIERLGTAGAMALQRFVRSGDTVTVAWGRTVLAVGEALRMTGLQDVRVVQATGAMAAGSPVSPERCAAVLAASLGAACIPLTAPSVVSSAEMRDMLLAEPLLQAQFAALGEANRVLFGIASLRPNSTIQQSGFFDSVSIQDYLARNAVGVIAGRFVNAQGKPVAGPLDARMIGLSLEGLKAIERRIAVAGGFDKVPAILAALRGGYANILVTDAATAKGLLDADGAAAPVARRTPRSADLAPAVDAGEEVPSRRLVKKFLNDPADVVDEMLDGALRAHHRHLVRVPGTRRAAMAVEERTRGVALVIGGGSGHEPCFLGYVGAGMASAVVVGNVFSCPPPEPIFQAASAVSRGDGVLFVYGNYAGDTMNFEMAADLALAEGIAVRTVVTTDDVASSPIEDRDGRRGVAGNIFVFKVAGAACALGMTLDDCARVTAKANRRCYSMGVALEPCSMPQSRRTNFALGAGDIEVGVGIHGEPGVAREPLRRADEITDAVIDRIFGEMQPQRGDRVAVLVNSFGGTPLMELYVLYRRVEQRLAARGIAVERSWVGHYCTSLDMVGASISLLHLDDELAMLLGQPCDTPALRVDGDGTT